ncbi:hypothetical protein IGI39_003365 [Enterococcus sp. AZ135]|uniref:pyocin knob domain-containing protein n=1 Tax=unclassified Enterococcus TaxID=2608891 RepID=UPI003F27169C
MAYEKQIWIPYDDNKTEEQNIQDGAVVTAERMNHLETGLDEHESDKENPHKVTAEQTGAYTQTQANERYMRKNATNYGSGDWDTYTEVGTFGVTNFTGANAPATGLGTGTLLVQAFGGGGTGRTQLFMNNARFYFRRYNGQVWETWQRIYTSNDVNDNFMQVYTTAIVAQDWNTLTSSGTYSVENSTGANKPTTGNAWGQLLVQNKGNATNNTTQLFIGDTDIYFRRKSGATTWGAWQKPTPVIATSAEVSAGTNNTKMITPKALADSNQATTDDVANLIKAEQLRKGSQFVWGENRQLSDPNPNLGSFGISDNNQYSGVPDVVDPYFTIDSNGLAVIKKAGTYKVTANIKRQFRTETSLWHYVALNQLNADGSVKTKWDWAPLGGTIRNRNRTPSQLIITLEVGQKLQPWSESSVSNSGGTSSPLQFLNVDQFGLERLGD